MNELDSESKSELYGLQIMIIVHQKKKLFKPLLFYNGGFGAKTSYI